MVTYSLAEKKDYKKLEEISVAFSLDLNKKAIKKENFNIESFIKKEKKFFKKNFNDKFLKFFICREEGKLVAYALIGIEEDNSSEGFVSELFVKPEFRKKGIATKLLKMSFKELKKRKCKDISITVHSENTKAVKLYKKFGFERNKSYFVDFVKKI